MLQRCPAAQLHGSADHRHLLLQLSSMHATTGRAVVVLVVVLLPLLLLLLLMPRLSQSSAQVQ
jgi:hypothetical protein